MTPLKTLMFDLDLSQADLARLCGVHRNTMSRWVRKDKAPPILREYLSLKLKIRNL